MLSATMQETQLRLCEALGVETYMEWVMDSSLESTGSPWENIESGLYCAEAAAPILNQQPIGGDPHQRMVSHCPAHLRISYRHFTIQSVICAP